MVGAPESQRSGAVSAVPARLCYLCKSPGNSVYQDLGDRLFFAQGRWDIRECKNRQCGLLWLDPRPRESELGELYKDYYTHSDTERNSLPRQAFTVIRDSYLSRLGGFEGGADLRQRLLSYVLELYPPKRNDFDFPMRYLRGRPKGRLLDLGCGAGLTLELAHRSGWDAEGIDPDSEAVANVQRKGLRARTGLLPELHLPAASYDAIVMNHVIEHLHDPLKIALECFRLLREGGLLLINTPNTESMGHRRFGVDWVALDPPRHLHLFAACSLRRLVEAAGFSVTELEAATGRAAGVLTASRAIARTGRFDMREAPTLYGRALELVEWMLSFRRPAGEEIRLVGQKRRI